MKGHIYLITLKFTQTLLKDMKVTIPAEINEVNPLNSWHVNIYKLNNRKHILFVNDQSRLCILIDGIRTNQLKALKEKFVQTLRFYLIHEEISQEIVETYINNANDVIISKTNNRSVLGTMKEIMIFTTDDFEDNLDRMKWLNRLIYKPIDYHYPIEVFKKALLEQK